MSVDRLSREPNLLTEFTLAMAGAFVLALPMALGLSGFAPEVTQRIERPGGWAGNPTQAPILTTRCSASIQWMTLF